LIETAWLLRPDHARGRVEVGHHAVLPDEGVVEEVRGLRRAHDGALLVEVPGLGAAGQRALQRADVRHLAAGLVEHEGADAVDVGALAIAEDQAVVVDGEALDRLDVGVAARRQAREQHDVVRVAPQDAAQEEEGELPLLLDVHAGADDGARVVHALRLAGLIVGQPREEDRAGAGPAGGLRPAAAGRDREARRDVARAAGAVGRAARGDAVGVERRRDVALRGALDHSEQEQERQDEQDEADHRRDLRAGGQSTASMRDR
jgi:hypothetical protein